MIYAFLIVVPLWILFPTRIERPPMPTDWSAAVYRGIATFDPPRCVMPCAHAIGPLAAAWFVAIDRPSWRMPLAAMLLLGLPSIPLTGQHRPIDLLIGGAATAAGIAIGETLRRRELRRRRTADQTP